MISKEFTESNQSMFPMTQLKMSLFLESQKDKLEQIEQDPSRQVFLYSMKKYQPNYVNIYQYKREKSFQDFMFKSLQGSVEFDYKNFNMLLSNQNLALDNINSKYNFTDVQPEERFGHLDEGLFKYFMESCFTSLYEKLSFNDRNNLYKKFL